MKKLRLVAVIILYNSVLINNFFQYLYNIERYTIYYLINILYI